MSWKDILKISPKEWAKIPKDKRKEAWAKLPASEKRALANEIEGKPPLRTGETGTRQTSKDLNREEFNRARWNLRGDKTDAANRGGKIDLENPVQENPETMNYRQHLGPLYGMINRISAKHSKWAARDKKNSAKHKKWIKMLSDYMMEVKQMIVSEDPQHKK